MTDDAEVRRDGDTAELRFRRHYPVPPDELWARLTQPDHLAAWLPEATIEPGPDGHLDFDWGDQGSGRAQVLTWSPPTLLELRWVETDGPASVVRFEVAADGAGSALTLVHRAIRVELGENGAGWHYYLDALGAHVDGRPSPGDAHFAALLQRYAGASA